jgi:hypothetical protein
MHSQTGELLIILPPTQLLRRYSEQRYRRDPTSSQYMPEVQAAFERMATQSAIPG